MTVTYKSSDYVARCLEHNTILVSERGWHFVQCTVGGCNNFIDRVRMDSKILRCSSGLEILQEPYTKEKEQKLLDDELTARQETWGNKKEEILKWSRQIHDLWDGSRCPALISKWHYQSWNYSILWPCLITNWEWELFDWEDVYRFWTLKEAKEKAESLEKIIKK